MNPKFINGPTNFAQLKGYIDGIEKEIYIFFDKHYELEDQTRCKSFDSVDISYYLYKLIKESKEKIDFFMEIQTTQINKNITNKKDIYIEEVMNLFKSEFIDKNNEENIKVSKINSNVRLHYFDIRDHLDIYYLSRIIFLKIKKYANLLRNCKINNNENNKKEYIEKILFYVEKINANIKLLNYNLNQVINNNIIYDKINDKQKYYLNKILNQYDNKLLAKNIYLFLNNHSNAFIKSIDDVIQNIKDTISNDILLNFNILDKSIDKLSEYILQLYSFFTDIYLLRRILDKNYVNKCIIYSGCSHSVNIIFFLIKYCNFTIIQIHKSSEEDLNTLKNKINNEFYSFNIYDLFMLKKLLVQCISWVPIGVNDTMSAKFHKYSKIYK